MQEINRLFDELVHHPWSRARLQAPMPAVRRPTRAPAAIVIEIPLKAAELANVRIEAEGRRLTVVLATRSRRDEGSSSGTSPVVEEHRQTFEIPEGARPGGFEAHFDGDTLRVRVSLCADEPEKRR